MTNVIPEIPAGWRFYSADAIDGSSCRVLLKRDEDQTAIWHTSIVNVEDEDLWPNLYIHGRGVNLPAAIAHASALAVLEGNL